MIKTCKNEDTFYFTEIKFDSWKELLIYILQWNNEYDATEKYVFRGHENIGYELKPGIERLLLTNSKKVSEKIFKKIELSYIEKFKLAYQFFDTSIIKFPSADQVSTLEWLSVMQHFGVATRLLDITRSPFIASFFAINNYSNHKEEKCIWAIPLSDINKRNFEKLKWNGKFADAERRLGERNYTENLLNGQSDKIIGYNFNTYLSSRCFNQQGGFIYALAEKDRLSDLWKYYFDNETSKLIKLVFSFNGIAEYHEAVTDLEKMNISYSTMFPDLEGYSKKIRLDQFITIYKEERGANKIEA
jgi:hypothetical protein